jgi:microcystin-dependent protein
MKLNRFLAGLALALCLTSSTFAATLLPLGRQVFQNANGAPLAGGTVTFYVPGTTNQKDTFQDPAASILNSNPILLDSAGGATIYGTGSYRQVVKDRNGNLIWDRLTSDTSSSTSSWGGTSTGTANAQQVAAPNFTSQDGQSISFIAGFGNTGPLTVNPSGAGPIGVVNDTPAGSASFSGGEIAAGSVVQLVYSATGGVFHTAVAPAGVPVGTLTAFAGNAAPVGYLLSQGQEVSRTTYARLFAAIGTAFGPGDGSTTFNLPAMGGRVPAGVDTNGATLPYTALNTLGGVVGEPTHAITTNELPPITPSGSVTVSYPAHTYSLPTSSIGVAGGTGATVFVATTSTSSTLPPGPQTFSLSMGSFGGGVAMNVMQPTIAVNYIIKY